MAEIEFHLSSEGGTEVAESLEDIQVKLHLAGEESKRLSVELRQIKESGQVSAQGIQELTRELVRSEAEQRKFAQAARQMEQATARMTQGARGFRGGGAEMVNMITEMSLGLGGISPQMREFTTVLAGAGNNVSQLASVLPGPVGIIAGLGASLLPLLITKIIQWNSETANATQANNDLARSARNAARDTRDLVTAMTSRRTADRMATIGQEGSTATAEDIGEVINQTRGQLDVFRRDVARERAEIARLNRERTSAATTELAERAVEDIRRHERALADLERGVVRLRTEEERLLAAQTRRMEGDLALGAREDEEEQGALALAEDPNRNRRRGMSDAEREEQARARREEQFHQSAVRAREERAAEELRLVRSVNEEILREERRMVAEEKALMREKDAEDVRLQEERKRRLEAEMEASLEKKIQTIEAEKALAREAQENLQSEISGVLGPALTGLTGAIKEIVSGSKSADEAFLGLLSSFLEMISQRAALEAAAEFAQAIGSFASQNYGAGALHLAAGVAWTAVAVAAGAASVAVAPPAAATPASPQQSAPAESGRGGDVVLNINGAIAFGGTRAELGREFGAAIELGNRRFGTAA